MRKKSLKNKEGSAMLIAIAIMAVLVMLGLALLLVSFSLHATVNREHDAAQCKEIVQTLSRELEQERMPMRREQPRSTLSGSTSVIMCGGRKNGLLMAKQNT